MRRLGAWLLLLALLLPLPVQAESGDFLYAGDAALVEPRGDPGPWLYDARNMTVTVSRRRFQGLSYTLADVFVRDGTIFRSGDAMGDVTRRRTEQPLRLARRYSAVLGITGDYINIASNPKGAMIRHGEIIYDEDRADTLAIFPDGRLAVYPKGTVRARELLEQGVRDSFAFGPILVMNGKAYEPALSHVLASPNRRCCLAMVEKGHYLAIATTSGFTNAQLQTLFLSFGVELAYSMDGGHSSSLIFMGEQLNRQPYSPSLDTFQRPLGDMLLLGESELVPSLTDPVRYTNTRTMPTAEELAQIEDYKRQQALAQEEADS